MTDVQLNDDWFRSILSSPGVQSLCRAKAEAALAQARATAPVKTGAYRNSLKIVPVKHEYRTTYEVVSDCDHALAVESQRGTLARALRSVRR